MKLTRPLPATIPKALTYGDGNFAIDLASITKVPFRIIVSVRVNYLLTQPAAPIASRNINFRR
jgi:hypothetical protein